MSRTHSPSRRLAALAISASLLFGAAACGSDDDETGADTVAQGSTDEGSGNGDTRQFEQPDGTVVEIPAEPQSIVACGYAVLPLVQAGANLSAVCEWTRELENMNDEEKAAYDAIDKVAPDGDVSSLDYEGVAAADPDLIIMGVPAMAKSIVDMERLEGLAPVVFIGPVTPGDWRTLGEQYADAAGVGDNYGEFKDEYEARAAEIEEAFSEQFADLTFGGICADCDEGAGTITVEYRSSYTVNLLDDLGLNFPGEPSNPDDVHGETLSLEQLTSAFADIDVIVYKVDADGSTPEPLATIQQSDAWKSLPAVQAGQVIEVEHARAATYRTALLALDSIEESLTELAAAL
ncbi:MAG: ABC transporter substrate-binding protein [Acidimicrobiales bacterium]|nr:ABC transporter substrate-binding protein [Acidimicrobiales bacterium]